MRSERRKHLSTPAAKKSKANAVCARTQQHGLCQRARRGSQPRASTVAAMHHTATSVSVTLNSSGVRNGCAQRMGTKVRTTQARTRAAAAHAGILEGEDIEGDDIPDGGKADEAMVVALALGIGEMKERRQQDEACQQQAEATLQVPACTKRQRRDEHVGHIVDDQIEPLAGEAGQPAPSHRPCAQRCRRYRR